MSYCLNPDCQKPQNPSDAKFCLRCGSRLLLGDRYRALKLIGQGGFGRTLLSLDEYKPSKPYCVIKQFFPQAQGTTNAQKAAQLFEQEAVRLDELGNHPQIPDLLAYCSQEQRQYLVQEFINGQNLAQELEEEGAFSETQIRQLLNDLLPILQFVHEGQVIHRDIKPENIIRRNSNQRLVLVDFGAAKFASDIASVKTGTVIGSAGYAAPEQAVGKAVFASDIYSLGVTCIYLLTNIPAFELYSFVEGVWVWRDYLSNPVSKELGQILDKMLEGAINRRYQSAAEVLNDLNPQPTRRTAVTNNKMPVMPAQPATQAPPISASVSQPQLWKCIYTLKGHSGWPAGICSVAISPNNQIVADASEDNTIKLWNLSTGKEIRTLHGHSGFVRAIAFSPDGQILVSGSNDKTIKLWNLSNGKQFYTLTGHSECVTTVAISPDGQWLASGSDDHTVKLWNLTTKQPIHTLSGHSNYIQSVAFSPDGQTLASGSCDYTIKLWNISTGREVFSLGEHSNWVKSVAISADGKLMASACFDNTLKLWDLVTGKVLHTLCGHSGWMNGANAVAFSPDSQTLASGADDKTIKIWDVNSGKVLCSLTGHLKGVKCVAFSSNGQILVSGSNDNTIKIWRCN